MVTTETENKELKNSAIIFAACLIVGVMSLFFIGRPLLNSIKKTEKEVAISNEYLAQLKNKLATLKKLKDKEEVIRENNRTVLNALPEDKEVSRLFMQFEKVTEESGLKISRASETGALITPDSTPSQGQSELIRNVLYTSEAKTSLGYGSVKASLVKFEQALRLLGIKEITISKAGEGADITVNYTLTTYVRSE